jgi:hypothetical protein
VQDLHSRWPTNNGIGNAWIGLQLSMVSIAHIIDKADLALKTWTRPF